MSKQLPKHLVLFQFSSNECCTEVSRTLPDIVTVDLPSGTWTTRGVTKRIGEANVPPSWMTRSGIAIGVYDTRKLEQVQSLVSTASSIANEGGKRTISMD